MKKLIIFLIMTATLLLPAAANAAPKKQKSTLALTYETKDSFIIKSKIIYPKVKKPSYPLVIMLHSLGYSSSYWTTLPKMLNDKGYAVLLVDLRGHGQSLYDSNFRIHYWTKYTDTQFSKYPKDVLEMLNYVLYAYKNLSDKDYVIIGADIGANTAILTAEQLKIEPKGIVLISPSLKFKGLYTPIAMTNLGSTPIMAIASKRDNYSFQQIAELKKFAQGRYDEKIYPVGGAGMLMLKANPTMAADIANWIGAILK